MNMAVWLTGELNSTPETERAEKHTSLHLSHNYLIIANQVKYHFIYLIHLFTAKQLRALKYAKILVIMTQHSWRRVLFYIE